MIVSLVGLLILASPAPDLGWLAKLPGVTVDGDAYPYTGDRDAMLAALEDGFAKHGWEAHTVEMAAIKGLNATKGEDKVLVVVGPKAFIVKAEKVKPGEQPVGKSSIGVFEDGATRSIACKGEMIGVRSSHGHITLTGSCDQLSVTGNGNAVTVKGSVSAVLVTGNDNVVTLPEKASPTIVDRGAGNRVVTASAARRTGEK